MKNIASRMWRNGKNSRISWLAYLDEYCHWGDHVYVDRFCVLHHAYLGEYSYVGYGSTLNMCEIGKFCSISSGVKIGLGNHPTHFVSTSPIFYSSSNSLGTRWVDETAKYFTETKMTVIGNDVWIGANALIMDGVSIADGSIVAAGAVVTRDVEPYTIVGGVPAKAIHQQFSTEVIADLLIIRWWDWDTMLIQQRALEFHDVAAFVDQYKQD